MFWSWGASEIDRAGCFTGDHYIYSSKAACQMLQVLHWTLANGNKFFRILYGEGIWFSGQIASQVIEAGYAFCDPELH